MRQDKKMRCGKRGVEGKLSRWNWKEWQKQRVIRGIAQQQRHENA